MNLEQINETMLEATQESVESFAFAEVFTSTDLVELDEDCLQVQMDVISPSTGTFILHASQAMIGEIAQSLFPSDEELTKAKTNDLASELLNTIGGNFLKKTLPESTSFLLGLPEITSPSPPNEHLLQWNFSLEEIPFSIYLTGEIINTL